MKAYFYSFKVLVLLVALLTNSKVKAQKNYGKLPRVGFNLTGLVGFTDIKSIDSKPAFNNKIGYQLYFEQPIAKPISLGLSFVTGKIFGSQTITGTDINFRTSVFSQSLRAIYNFRPFIRSTMFMPHVGVGVGFLSFRSKGNLKDKLGNFYSDYDSLQTIEKDDTYETDLRQANLDRFGNFPQITFQIPFFAGIDIKLNKGLCARINFEYHQVFSDMLDNISVNGAGARKGNKGYDNFLVIAGGINYNLSFAEDEKPRDMDNDGIVDSKDRCDKTPAGVRVDAKGCPIDFNSNGTPDYLEKGTLANQDYKNYKIEEKKKVADAKLAKVLEDKVAKGKASSNSKKTEGETISSIKKDGENQSLENDINTTKLVEINNLATNKSIDTDSETTKNVDSSIGAEAKRINEGSDSKSSGENKTEGNDLNSKGSSLDKVNEKLGSSDSNLNVLNSNGSGINSNNDNANLNKGNNNLNAKESDLYDSGKISNDNGSLLNSGSNNSNVNGKLGSGDSNSNDSNLNRGNTNKKVKESELNGNGSVLNSDNGNSTLIGSDIGPSSGNSIVNGAVLNQNGIRSENFAPSSKINLSTSSSASKAKVQFEKMTGSQGNTIDGNNATKERVYEQIYPPKPGYVSKLGRFAYADFNKDNIISVLEVNQVIDMFFDRSEKLKLTVLDVQDLIDYFFDQ